MATDHVLVAGLRFCESASSLTRNRSLSVSLLIGLCTKKSFSLVDRHDGVLAVETLQRGAEENSDYESQAKVRSALWLLAAGKKEYDLRRTWTDAPFRPVSFDTCANSKLLTRLLSHRQRRRSKQFVSRVRLHWGQD